MKVTFVIFILILEFPLKRSCFGLSNSDPKETSFCMLIQNLIAFPTMKGGTVPILYSSPPSTEHKHSTAGSKGLSDSPLYIPPKATHIFKITYFIQTGHSSHFFFFKSIIILENSTKGIKHKILNSLIFNPA